MSERIGGFPVRQESTNRSTSIRTKILLGAEGVALLAAAGIAVWSSFMYRPDSDLKPRDDSFIPYPERGSDIGGFYVMQYSPRLLWIRDRDGRPIELKLARTQKLVQQIDEKCSILGPLQSIRIAPSDNNILEMTVATQVADCRTLLS